MSNKKSGQAALILVIVTMVTVLGIGIASSTQSTINLRDTVYSVQSEQALACAEAGGEYAIAVMTQNDPEGIGNYDLTAPNSRAVGTGYLPCESTGCVTNTPPASYDCIFEYAISKIPGADGIVTIPKLNENNVQELNFAPVNSSTNLDANISLLGGNSARASLAVYYYISDGSGVSVDRKFYYIGTEASKPADLADFEDEKDKAFTLSVPANTVAIRIRPLYADVSILLNDYPTTTAVGYGLSSIGRSGSVRRIVSGYKFLNQLPAAFDEAVVMLD